MITQFFRAVFHELFRSKALYNVLACLVLLSVVASGYFWQESYVSQASITIGQRSGTSAKLDIVDQQSLADSLTNIFGSRTFQMQLLGEFTAITADEDVDTSLRRLHREARLHLENLTLARLSYTSADPVQAQQRMTFILQALLDRLQPKRDTSVLQTERAEIQDAKRALTQSIAELDEKINALRLSSVDADNESLKQRIAATRKDIQDVEVNINATNAKISGIVSKLEKETSNQNAQKQLNALNVRRDYLLSRLESLKKSNSFSASEAASLQREIDELSAEINIFSGKNAQNLQRSLEESELFRSHLRNSLSVEEVELSALLSRQESLRKLLRQARSEATADESGMIQIEAQQRELQSMRQELDALDDREQENTQALAAEKAFTPNYVVLDKPNLPQNYSGLGVIEFLVAGPLLAAFLPFLMASSIVIFDSRIRTTGQVSALIPQSVPVMSVPNHNSPRTLRLFHRVVLSLLLWGAFVFCIYFTLGFIGLAP